MRRKEYKIASRTVMTVLAGIVLVSGGFQPAHADETWTCFENAQNGKARGSVFSVKEHQLFHRGDPPFQIVRDGDDGIVAVAAASVWYVWTIVINRKTGAYVNVQMHDDGSQYTIVGKCRPGEPSNWPEEHAPE